MAHDTYTSPFQTRYASKRCSTSSRRTINSRRGAGCGSRWRRPKQKQGLPITDAQIAELEAHKDDINYDVARRGKRSAATT